MTAASTSFAVLESRALLRVSGPEAGAFLQGLITNDIEKAAPDKPIFAVLLTPQGKVQFDFIVWHQSPDIYLVDCEIQYRDDLFKRLKLFKLRAKVELMALEHATVAAAWGGEVSHPLATLPANAARDPRLGALGIRIIWEDGKDVQTPKGWAEKAETDYIDHRLALHVPEGRDELGMEKVFALEANLEELNGVSFKKGCYVGQELTARMKHKTELKKRLLPLRLSQTPAPGSSVRTEDREIGQLIGSTATTGFALVRLDRLNGVLEGDFPLMVDGHGAQITWPASYLEPPAR